MYTHIQTSGSFHPGSCSIWLWNSTSVCFFTLHTHIFHMGKMAFTHLLIPQKMENNGLGIQVSTLFTQEYSSLSKKKKPHTHTFLPLLHHVSLIHKVKAYAVCWSGGNAINLALIYFTSFCCCPGLDDFSQDLRSLTVWSHHTTNPHHTNSRSIGHSVIWRMTAARYFYSLNNKFPFCTFSRTPTWSWYSQLNTITDDIAWSTNLETWHISPFKKKTFLSLVCCEYLNRDATEYE